MCVCVCVSLSLRHVVTVSCVSVSLPLEGVKRKIMRQLRTLEQEDMVSSGDNYQEIINAIAKVTLYSAVSLLTLSPPQLRTFVISTVTDSNVNTSCVNYRRH